MLALSLTLTLSLSLVVASCGKTHLYPIQALDASLDPAPPVDSSALDAPAPDRVDPDTSRLDLGGAELPEITVCPEAVQLGYSTSGAVTADPATTGGAGGVEVTVTTPEDLIAAAARADKVVIRIAATITLTDPVVVKSDKTIEGVAPGDGLVGGGLSLKDNRNVIIRKLSISHVYSPNDAVALNNTQNVWIDHCDMFSDLEEDKGTYDGLVDITHGSDFVTVSWNVFHDHYHTTLVGNSNAPDIQAQDTGHLHVTYHHNWFRRTVSYNPRVRFGSVHVLNNLYEDDVAFPGIAIISQEFAQVLVEGNVFKNVAQPIVTKYDDPDEGTVWLVNNSFTACGDSLITMTRQWSPPYAYTVEPTDYTEAVIKKCAGLAP